MKPCCIFKMAVLGANINETQSRNSNAQPEGQLVRHYLDYFIKALTDRTFGPKKLVHLFCNLMTRGEFLVYKLVKALEEENNEKRQADG